MRFNDFYSGTFSHLWFPGLSVLQEMLKTGFKETLSNCLSGYYSVIWRCITFSCVSGLLTLESLHLVA